jgi:hypothetical protein
VAAGAGGTRLNKANIEARLGCHYPMDPDLDLELKRETCGVRHAAMNSIYLSEEWERMDF